MTYIVTFKSQVNSIEHYGMRVEEGQFATLDEANGRACYIANFFDSCVAIERVIVNA